MQILVCHISTEKDRDDLADVDNLMLIRQIETFQQNETLTEKARDILSKTDFNFKATMEGRVKGIEDLLNFHSFHILYLTPKPNYYKPQLVLLKIVLIVFTFAPR